MADQERSESLSQYEAPELIEIGAAGNLTLGAEGMNSDSLDCQNLIEWSF